MTGREAADEQEHDEARRRRREEIQTQEGQEEHFENSFLATQMVADSQLRYSQRETQLALETHLSALSQLSKTPSVELSSEDNSSSTENLAQSQEPRRSGRVKRLTCDACDAAS